MVKKLLLGLLGLLRACRFDVMTFEDDELRRHEGKTLDFSPLSERDEQIAAAIVDAALLVHRSLGAGLLESVYETCFCYELEKRGISVRRQVIVPVVYDGLQFDEGFRLDALVEERVICEIKAVTEMNPIYQAQLLTYLKLMNLRLGFLINFNVPRIKDGIKRLVR